MLEIFLFVDLFVKINFGSGVSFQEHAFCDEISSPLLYVVVGWKFSFKWEWLENDTDQQDVVLYFFSIFLVYLILWEDTEKFGDRPNLQNLTN